VSPAQKLTLPVVATTVLPDNISREKPVNGKLYWAIFRLNVAAEEPVLVALASTVDPDTISATSPAGTFATLTTLLSVE
jgi:hypothetical protein